MRPVVAFAAWSPCPETDPRAVAAVSALALALAGCMPDPPPARAAAAEVTVGDETPTEVNTAPPPSSPSSPPSSSPPPPPYVTEEHVPESPSGFALAAALFDEPLPEFDLTLSDEALEALRVDPYTWVEGTFTYGGATYDPVGIRLKGNNSFEPIDAKPSLKVKLDHVENWDLMGLENLTFDNMSSDKSMIRERLAYRVFRELGLPAARANHAVVRINGEDRGLYTLVETVNHDFLELWYPDATGSLWEAAGVEYVDEEIVDFEIESGVDDRAPLQAVADALELGDPLAYDEAGYWVDWPQFVDFVATTLVVGQFDSYPWSTPGNDMHVYVDPADGLLDTVPHGMDETFEDDRYDPYSGVGLLFLTCMANPACVDDYDASIWDAQAVAEQIDLLGYAEEVQAEIDAMAYLDPRRPYTYEQVLTNQARVLDFIASRREILSELVP
jgi:hypothetical protein